MRFRSSVTPGREDCQGTTLRQVALPLVGLPGSASSERASPAVLPAVVVRRRIPPLSLRQHPAPAYPRAPRQSSRPSPKPIGHLRRMRDILTETHRRVGVMIPCAGRRAPVASEGKPGNSLTSARPQGERMAAPGWTRKDRIARPAGGPLAVAQGIITPARREQPKKRPGPKNSPVYFFSLWRITAAPR